jgi:hypothetical protein
MGAACAIGSAAGCSPARSGASVFGFLARCGDDGSAALGAAAASVTLFMLRFLPSLVLLRPRARW